MSEDVHKFETGAVRSNDLANQRWDLISPIALKEIAETYSEGAIKRGEFNWESGMPVKDVLNHAIAHIYNFLGGDRSEPHLAHAAWNIMAAIHSMKVWPELNERWLRGPGCTQPPAAAEAAAKNRGLNVPDRIVIAGSPSDYKMPEPPDNIAKMLRDVEAQLQHNAETGDL